MSDSSAKPYYDAEFELRFILQHGGQIDFYGSTLTVPEERKFGDLDGVRRYIERVCDFVGWDGQVPAVAPRRGQASAHYDHMKHTICVPMHLGSQHSWAMRESVILHELAHAMTRGHGHDEVFCSKLVELVDKCIGPEAGLFLAAAYDRRGISVKRCTL